MKFIKLGLLGVIAMFLITSCETDPIDPGTGGGGGGGTDQGPELIFVEQAGSLTADSNVAPGEIFSVTLQGAKGTADLDSLTIKENGERLEDFANRITIDGQPAPSSAILLVNTNPASFTWTISIKAQENAAKHLYEFLLEDTNGLSASKDIEIDTEPTGSGTDKPAILLMGNTSIITETEALVSFPITALRGNSDLSYIAVVDVVNNFIDSTRCYLGDSFDSREQFLTNPQALSADDAAGFAKTVWIRAQGTESIETYFIVLFDAAENLVLKEVTINTYPNGVAGNDLDTKEGILFNRAGPSGTGGLDLDSGASTGSQDTAAELIDNGIDSGPVAQNWLQRISGTNGTTLKQLIPNVNGLSENFTFDSVTKDTQLLDIWVNGSDLTGTNPDLVPWTDVVNVGDMFIAEREGKYYMIVVTNITIDPLMNNDSYTMDIKL